MSSGRKIEKDRDNKPRKREKREKRDEEKERRKAMKRNEREKRIGNIHSQLDVARQYHLNVNLGKKVTRSSPQQQERLPKWTVICLLKLNKL